MENLQTLPGREIVKKRVFVMFTEGGQSAEGLQSMLVSDKAAEDEAAFIRWQDGGESIHILVWFEIPETWENATASGDLRFALEAILPLDGLAEFPIVSDLLATVFKAGFTSSSA